MVPVARASIAECAGTLLERCKFLLVRMLDLCKYGFALIPLRLGCAGGCRLGLRVVPSGFDAELLEWAVVALNVALRWERVRQCVAIHQQ